jgi:hypothetical protein
MEENKQSEEQLAKEAIVKAVKEREQRAASAIDEICKKENVRLIGKVIIDEINGVTIPIGVLSN